MFLSRLDPTRRVSVEFDTAYWPQHCCAVKAKIPYYPAIVDGSVIVFGSNAVCKFLAKDNQSLDANSLASNNLLDVEEFKLASPTITPGT